MHSSGLYKDPAFSVSVGIAALILEGRPNYNVYNDVLLNFEESRSSSSDTFLVSEFGRARSEDTTTQRISQKLQQIRNYPSTSKDYVENSVEISVGSPSSHSDEFAERIYVNRKFRNNEYHPGVPPQYRTTATAKSATRSLFKNIDLPWTETSIVYNALEKIKMLHNISPLKLTPITKHHTKKKHSSGLNLIAQGPHCEQFLKKIGLVKSEGCDENDHKCEYFNNIVSTTKVLLWPFSYLVFSFICSVVPGSLI